jgi:lysophospholipase L1-like esterase
MSFVGCKEMVMRNKLVLCKRGIVSFLLVCLLFACMVTDVHATKHLQQSSLLAGPKRYYLALGDSLAFGYQPDWNFARGYASEFFQDLKQHGTQTYVNLGCPGETSSTMIYGGCPYAVLRKYPYLGTQLDAAVNYLHAHSGNVSPVTLDIGANDLISGIDPQTCSVDASAFNAALVSFDTNLTQMILPQLHDALLVGGRVTGDLIVNNYYDPFQNVCPETVSYVQQLNQHIIKDVSSYGIVVDTFSAFGGSTTPNPHICTYTWMCSVFKDIHATNTGYSVIAATFEHTTGY